MNLKDKVIRFFLAPFPLKRRKRRKLTARDVIRRYSRGNVNLQLGRVVLNDEYREMRARIYGIES